MRDKFSDLISQGVAEFKYTNISKSIPEQDPICRMYNNIWSIPSDTHMSCLDDGRRVITGHMININDQWDKFTYACNWGAVNFRTTGFWSLCDFLNKYDLCGQKGVLNGDVVYYITPREKCDINMPNKLTTNESNIPQPITVITTTGNKMHIQECFEDKDVCAVAKKMNESLYIKGSNWVPAHDSIVGLIDDKVYIIKNQ